MKLYDYKGAPNARRVRIFLAEKGIEVPKVEVDLAKAENRQPPYLEKNPMGGVPLLELDDGTLIAESVAICRFFEEIQPSPPLLGVDARDRALVEMWQRRMELEVALPIMNSFRHTHEFFKGRIPQVPEWGQVSREHAVRRLSWLDGELARRPFIAGERYTIADITAQIGIDFGRLVKLDTSSLPNVQRWHAEVSARPSAKA